MDFLWYSRSLSSSPYCGRSGWCPRTPGAAWCSSIQPSDAPVASDHWDARRALAACNVFAASQCLYQTGIELPVASSADVDVFSMDRGWLWDLSKCHAFHKLVTPCCTMLHLGGWACGALSSSSSFLGSPWKPLERGPRAACSILAPTPWAILHGCLGSISAAEWVQCLDTYTIDLMDSVMECVMDCVMHVIVPIKNFFICIWLDLYDSVLICHEFRRNEDIRAIRKSVETAILYGRSRLKPWTSFVNFWIINLGGKSGKKMVKGGYWDSLC